MCWCVKYMTPGYQSCASCPGHFIPGRVGVGVGGGGGGGRWVGWGGGGGVFLWKWVGVCRPSQKYGPVRIPRLWKKSPSPLGYQTLKHANMRPIEIPDTFPQNWGIMWFQLTGGSDFRCLAGLCQGALCLWCTASGEDRKPNGKHYVGNVN